MPSIDLNIISRGIQGTKWTAQKKALQAADLDDVIEGSSDNGKALNSLPTPFARFFIFKEAFRRVKEEYLNSKKSAGDAYKRLVSDCLDVYELIFDLKHYRNIWGDESDIVILEWEKKANMDRLKTTNKLLENALSETYDHDINEDTLYFVLYKSNGKEYLIGTSSPFTGFITPPDLDKEEFKGNHKIIGEQYKNLNIKRKSGEGFFFKDILLFEKRSTEFKNFMYNLFTKNIIDKKFKEIESYICCFEHDEDVKTDYPLVTTEVLSVESSPVVVNGLKIMQNDEIDINSFFQPCIIHLPYKLSDDDFEGITYKRVDNNRKDDYLIPFNSGGLSLLQKGAQYCCIVKTTGVQVDLEYNGFTYSKHYSFNPSNVLEGKIIDLEADNKYINIGVFPNILSYRTQENNYFKVALAETEDAQNFLTLGILNVSLSFYKQDGNGIYNIIPEENQNTHASNGVYVPVVRSAQSLSQNGDKCGTKYYEIFNTDFDAIEINIQGASGMVLPKWRRSQPSNYDYTYAIDLGTSNTFVSRVLQGSQNVPVQLELKEPMVSYMHEYSRDNRYSAAYRIESALHDNVRNALITQFAPAQIDGKEYDLPVRTALCHERGTAAKARLFDNTNIAFFYGKAMQNISQEVITDIKWVNNKEQLECFVRELMLIIKVDILQNNGNINQTRLVRFRPLSFDSNTKKLNDDVWDSVPADVFGTKPNSIQCYTESEAPYYYFTQSNIITNTNSVAVVDIGGGSTDMVYFQNNKALAASSIHFGCDVLWGEGHSLLKNQRLNGIFLKYDHKYVMSDPEIENIHSAMTVDSSVTAKDIINFWISNQKYCDIAKNLRSDYTPLFAYHLTSIIYYMASMYKYKGFDAPRTIVFSGNGSRYIDDFITSDTGVLSVIITMIFKEIYGEIQDIFVILPTERKENTCYGGLYRSSAIPPVPETVYHGTDREYSDAEELIKDTTLKSTLMERYIQMNRVYVSVISKLKNLGVIDNAMDVSSFTSCINDNYRDNLDTHFLSEVVQVYNTPGSVCNDSVFFIPVIDKIFELTKQN